MKKKLLFAFIIGCAFGLVLSLLTFSEAWKSILETTHWLALLYFPVSIRFVLSDTPLLSQSDFDGIDFFITAISYGCVSLLLSGLSVKVYEILHMRKGKKNTEVK